MAVQPWGGGTDKHQLLLAVDSLILLTKLTQSTAHTRGEEAQEVTKNFIDLDHPKTINFLTLIKGKIHTKTDHEGPEGA